MCTLINNEQKGKKKNISCHLCYNVTGAPWSIFEQMIPLDNELVLSEKNMLLLVSYFTNKLMQVSELCLNPSQQQNKKKGQKSWDFFFVHTCCLSINDYTPFSNNGIMMWEK